jgi:hypothetical protein
MIAQNAAAKEIFKDVRTAASEGAAQSEAVAAITAKELAPVVLVIDELEAGITSAEKAAAPFVSATNATYASACAAVRMVHDITWNYIGRPASDGKFALLFPGGADHYIDGEAEKLPDRMELLAQLFEKNLHPKLSAAQNQEAAGKLRDAAKAYQDALDAARIPVAKLVLLERTRTTMGRSAHATLANYKRLLKVAGLTEAQIHAIIPNRPRAPKKTQATGTPTEAKPAEGTPTEAKPAEGTSIGTNPIGAKPIEVGQTTG